MKYDACVVGAGAIGCIAARHCADAGLRVSVVEEHAKPGKFGKCTGIISKEGLDSTGIDYSNSVQNEIRGCVLSSCGEEMLVDARRTVALVIDRQEFDEECRREAGADFKFNARAIGFGGGVKTTQGAIKSDFVVGADGAASFTAKRLGFPPLESTVLAWQAEYSRAKVRDEGLAEVLLEPEFNGFFGWLVPSGRGRCRVGFAVRDNQQLLSSKKALLSNPIVKAALAGARKSGEFAALIPISRRRRTVKGSALLVGDAAGQVKATTGGGIVFGAKCARVLADCLARGETEAYESAWRREARVLGLHSLIRQGFDALPASGVRFGLAAGKLFGAPYLLSNYGDMDGIFSKK